MLCDVSGVPLLFFVVRLARRNLERLGALGPGSHPRQAWSPREHCRRLLVGKRYGPAYLRQYCDRYRMRAVIPLGAVRREPKPGLRRLFDRRNTGSATSSSGCSAV